MPSMLSTNANHSGDVMQRLYREHKLIGMQILAGVALLAGGIASCRSDVHTPCSWQSQDAASDTDVLVSTDAGTLGPMDVEDSATDPDILEEGTFCADGRRWNIEGVGRLDETLHSDAVGVLGANGAFHLAYADRTHLFYGVKTGGVWEIEAVDRTDSYGLRTIDMVVDANGEPHVVYGRTPTGVSLIHKSEMKWTITELGGLAGCPCSLAVDDDGRHHIAAVGDGLQYLTGAGGSWSMPVMLSFEAHFRGVSLVLDDIGVVNISSYWPALNYATNAGGDWVVQQVTRGGIDSSAAFDPDGNLHIVHSESPLGDLILSTKTANEWSNRVWEPADQRHTAMPDLAIDSEGIMHMVQYRDNGIGYASLRVGETEWREIALSSDQTPWTMPRITIDDAGEEIHIVYGRQADIAHVWTVSDPCGDSHPL